MWLDKINSIQLVKYKQQILMVVVVSVILGIVLFVVLSIRKAPLALEVAPQPKELDLTTAGKRVPAEEVWRDKMQDAQQQLSQNIAELKQQFDDNQEKLNLQSDLMSDMIKKINDETKEQTLPNNYNQEVQAFNSPAAPQVMRVKLNLTAIKSHELKTTDNTIPAGSFAKAVLLSGVDALTAISSQGNPSPMLLRIVDFGTLPRKFTSDVKDCHITTGAYGNLASERVHARLEKLTCVERATGEIIETQVAGFIAGPDGKEGIRGTVVSKDAAFLARSLWGSIFSGVGNVLSPLNRQNLSSPMSLFGSGNQQSSKQLFKSGMAESSSRALDRVSEYYINKAEQEI